MPIRSSIFPFTHVVLKSFSIFFYFIILVNPDKDFQTFSFFVLCILAMAINIQISRSNKRPLPSFDGYFS